MKYWEAYYWMVSAFFIFSLTHFSLKYNIFLLANMQHLIGNGNNRSASACSSSIVIAQ